MDFSNQIRMNTLLMHQQLMNPPSAWMTSSIQRGIKANKLARQSVVRRHPTVKVTMAKDTMFYQFLLNYWPQTQKIHNRLKALQKIFQMRRCWSLQLYSFRNGIGLKKNITDQKRGKYCLFFLLVIFVSTFFLIMQFRFVTAT